MTIKIKAGTTANETLTGTAGTDWLFGLGGNDVLIGGKGADVLVGSLGNDTLQGDAGGDTLTGGAGKDVFSYKNFSEVEGDNIVDFAASDSINFSAIAVANRHFIGNQAFNGTAGEIRYSNELNGVVSPSGVVYSGNRQTVVEIDSNGDAVADVSMALKWNINLVETAPNSGVLIIATNQITSGTAKGETLTGGAGKDILSGNGGNDRLIGGEGNDRLNGGAGKDVLSGGFGSDRLTGGKGNDTFKFSSTDSLNGDKVVDFSGGDKIVIDIPSFTLWGDFIGDAEFNGQAGQYRFHQSNTSSGSSFNANDQSRLEFDFNGDAQTDGTILFGTLKKMLQESVAGSNKLTLAADQVFNGTSGADSKTTGNGNDTLNGLAGNDTLKGGMGNDTLNGGDGNDALYGGTGDDQINGGAGADILVGGQGKNALTGGLGNDVFKFLSIDELAAPGLFDYGFYGSGVLIADFTSGDKIDLSGVDANANLSGNQKFVFIGTNEFSGVEGELQFDKFTGAQGDINGDGIADFTITLSNAFSLTMTASDFVL